MPHFKINLIEKKVLNTANEKELDEFNRLSETDAGFKEIASKFEKILLASDQSESENLLQFLKQEERQIQQEERIGGRKFKWLWLLISLIVLFSILVYIFAKQVEPSTPPQIYATHFEPYRNIAAPVSRGEVPQNDYEKAFYFYENSDYEQAFPLMKRLNDQKADTALNFYLGILSLENQHFEEARQFFYLISKNDVNYAQATEWYIALSYLGQSEEALAKKMFIEIAETEGHFFKVSARAVLTEMGGF